MRLYHKRSFFCYKEGIQLKKQLNDLSKELLRKAIHMCAAFVPLMLSAAYVPVMVLLSLVLVLYCVAEFLRCRGVDVPFVSAVTTAAARKRDENRFVLGPATLAAGVLCTAALFPSVPASVGILALAFGDGLASLAGKFLGRIVIPYSTGKTVAGSLACFVAIFCSSFLVLDDAGLSFLLALAGMGIELLPLKDFDNLIIPVVIASLCHFALRAH